MDERIWFGLYQSCQNRGSVGRVCVCLGCGGLGVGAVGGEWAGDWTRVWRGGVVLCLCEMWV